MRSTRIQEDLVVAADRLESASTATANGAKAADAEPFNLVVREFAGFEVQNEVRRFAYRGRFTALTQYTQLCCIPSLLAQKHATAAAVATFMAELIPRVSFFFFFFFFLFLFLFRWRRTSSTWWCSTTAGSQ